MEKQKESQEPKKHDGINVDQAEQFLTTSKESQKEMYKVLQHLRTYNGYKGNARYKNAPFKVYLEDIFAISESKYRENERAFREFPEYALEYGIGMVSKVVRVCGRLRVNIVFADINKVAAAHKTPLSRAKIETIIQKHRIIHEHKKATRRDQPKGTATE